MLRKMQEKMELEVPEKAIEGPNPGRSARSR